MKAFIGNKCEEIALSKLIVVPHFLRFNLVALVYRSGSQSIDQKCDSFRVYLSAIKATLNDSNIIHFNCQINGEDQSQFRNHSTLIEHIRHIVSICDSSRGYSFELIPVVLGDYETVDDYESLVAPILQMPSIVRCSFVLITPECASYRHLPIEIISNWLNRERHAMGQNQRKRELILNFAFDDARIQEMCDFLKQVSFPFTNKPFIHGNLVFIKRLQYYDSLILYTKINFPCNC